MPSLNRRTLFHAATTAGLVAATATAAHAQSASGGPNPAAAAGTLHLPAPDGRQGKTIERGRARVFHQKTGQGAPLVLLHSDTLSGALFGRVVDRPGCRTQIRRLEAAMLNVAHEAIPTRHAARLRRIGDVVSPQTSAPRLGTMGC